MRNSNVDAAERRCDSDVTRAELGHVFYRGTFAAEVETNLK